MSGKEQCVVCEVIVPVEVTTPTIDPKTGDTAYICDECCELKEGEPISEEEILENTLIPKPHRIKL